MSAAEPCNISIDETPVALTVGENHTFTATVTDCDGNTLGDAPVRWTATGGGPISDNGDYQGLIVGDYEVQASSGLITVAIPVSISLYSGPLNLQPEKKARKNTVTNFPFVQCLQVLSRYSQYLINSQSVTFSAASLVSVHYQRAI